MERVKIRPEILTRGWFESFVIFPNRSTRIQRIQPDFDSFFSSSKVILAKVFSKAKRNQTEKYRKCETSRIKRIGEILAQGVALLVAQESNQIEAEVDNVAPLKISSTETAVLNRLLQRGEMSPSELLDHLEVSRATLTRNTSSLIQKGLLQGLGNTSALRYCLTAKGLETARRGGK